MDEEKPLRSDALEIEKAAERASRLTSQLLVFSRNEVVQRSVVDLAEVLGGLTALLARTVREGSPFRPTWSARCSAWRQTRRRWSRCCSTSW